MNSFAKVNRLRRDEHTDHWTERNHRVDLTAASTRSSVAASTPTGTRTVAPAIVTSIRSAGYATTRGGSGVESEVDKLRPCPRPAPRFAPPHIEQSSADPVAPRHLGYVHSRIDAL